MDYCFYKKLIQTVVEQKWKEEFHGQVFFSHGKANSCGVVTAHFVPE